MLARLGNSITTRIWFDLPNPFEHGHLVNEIDEIAEQYKQARKGFFLSPLTVLRLDNAGALPTYPQPQQPQILVA